jgi:DNA-cytosine methyltransferase
MNILSLFDGMSCGQLALQRIGITNYRYYASEIDKYAIQVTQHNFPDTIQLGDVKAVNADSLPKIDLLLAGSPCQGFSFAGKQLAFDDPRSQLFFQFVRILRECKPKYFILENVRMKREHLDVITEHVGVEPILINSALVSAQNRQRYYRTNIPNVTQPADKGVVLLDIIDVNVTSFSSETTAMRSRTQRNVRSITDKAKSMTASQYKGAQSNGVTIVNCKEFVDRDKAHCLDANYYKGGNLNTYFNKHRRQLVFCSAMRGRYVINGKRQDHKHSLAGMTTQRLEPRFDGKTNCLKTVTKDNLVCRQVASAIDIKGFQSIKRIYSVKGKSPTITTMTGGHRQPKILQSGKAITYRKLTPVECERLQTVPDDYTAGVSNTQRYKMLGNGWTVDVIAHILKGITE